MIDSLPRVARLLSDLVAFDTRNPMGKERPMADHLAALLARLGARKVEVIDKDGHASTFALFGEGSPRRILNAHIDTVPANSGYSSNPHTLVQSGTRVVGLGSADTKGAIAAIIEALQRRADAGHALPSVAVLFSGDEELGGACIRDFLASDRIRGLTHAVVCEPTGCRVGKRHRGLQAFRLRATSKGGHSSLAATVPNPMAQLARVAVALEDLGQKKSTLGPPGLQGICMNIAAMEGGVAFNVIPSAATLTFSMRPGPGVDRTALIHELTNTANGASTLPLAWEDIAFNPAFATQNLTGFLPSVGTVADAIDLPYGTEAGQFVEAGIDAVVYGPGKVEQAHAADEFVELDELEEAVRFYGRVLD